MKAIEGKSYKNSKVRETEKNYSPMIKEFQSQKKLENPEYFRLSLKSEEIE